MYTDVNPFEIVFKPASLGPSTAQVLVIVTEGIHLRFVAALADRIAALRVGHVLDPETQISPIALLIRVRDYEDALSVANEVEFGLASGICTVSLKYASDFRRRSAACMVMVNPPAAGVELHVSFGKKEET